jgi:hypothetical protein
MKVGVSRKVQASRCKACGYRTDAATSVGSDAKPKPGDFTVCIRCGHVMAFDDKLKLRNLTSEEMNTIAGDARLLAIQFARGKIERTQTTWPTNPNTASAMRRSRKSTHSK